MGAAEYYDLTKDKGDAAADMTYEDMLAAGVGIEAPDDYTLVFTLSLIHISANCIPLPRGSGSSFRCTSA